MRHWRASWNDRTPVSFRPRPRFLSSPLTPRQHRAPAAAVGTRNFSRGCNATRATRTLGFSVTRVATCSRLPDGHSADVQPSEHGLCLRAKQAEAELAEFSQEHLDDLWVIFGSEVAAKGLYSNLIPVLSQPAFESCPSIMGARRPVQRWPLCRSAYAARPTHTSSARRQARRAARRQASVDAVTS